MLHITYCEFHLGDNLFHLHFLRGLARKYPEEKFIHLAHDCHLPQMREVVEDVPAIELLPLERRHDVCVVLDPSDALDSWKNAGGFFQDFPENWRYYEFYLEWFAHHARQMGLESPFRVMTDLLFDYPALQKMPVNCFGGPIDILFVNSQPCSGQWLAYDDMEQRRGLNLLARELCAEHDTIVTQKIEIDGAEHFPERCTRNRDLSVTGIGHLSLRARYILMIGTGPAWPTCNIWNTATPRTVLFEPERVNYLPNIKHARNLAETRAILEADGLL